MSNIDKQALRERYSEKPAPKCHICGSVMTIQRAGAGGVVYGCTGRIDKDGEGYKFAEGRDFADDHYARSRVTVTDESDPDVLELLDELEAKDKRIAALKARESVVIIKPPVIGRAYSALNRVWTEQEVRKACELAGVKLHIAAAGKGA